jgi:CRP-like cAMP-binding protein
MEVLQSSFDVRKLIRNNPAACRLDAYVAGETVFRQGEPVRATFYILNGTVKLSVLSSHGKEASIAFLTEDNFFGVESLYGDIPSSVTATVLTGSAIVRFEKAEFHRLLREEPGFNEMFIVHSLERVARVQDDLLDQLFNSTEKRLARTLLLLANFGKGGEIVVGRISQAVLAERIGTTRARVNTFMNKFRKLGYIQYERDGDITVRSTLLNRILDEIPEIEEESVFAGGIRASGKQ